MKKITLLLACLTASLLASAQDPISILRFSRLYPYGSARSAGMAGAFGALGGDLSTIHVNPAGVGVFRGSELNITPYLDFDQARTPDDKRSKTSFRLCNLGFVFNIRSGQGILKNVNIGFNYINMNNFNRNILQYGGVNDYSSLIDVWKSQADGRDVGDLDGDAWLAYETVLLDPDPNNAKTYFTPLESIDKVEQERYITERGYQGEYALSMGVNLADKFYLGGSLGKRVINYKYAHDYRELVHSAPDENGNYSPLDEILHQVIFESAGSGINFKIGAIYRPIPALRLGLAIHTPTYFKLSAYNESTIRSYFNAPPLPNQQDTRYSKSLSSDEYNYNLTTPWHFITSIAAVLGPRAIISLDYEFVDYPFVDIEDTYLGEYDWIRDFFKNSTRSAHDLRVGVEVRANSFLSLRGGYTYQGSPYAKGDWNENNYTQGFTAGLGFNLGSVYVDVAHVYKRAKDVDYFYSHETANDLLRSNKIHTTFTNREFRCTLGLKL